MAKKKLLIEYGNQWILKRPAPFKIEPAGGYTADMRPELKRDWLLRQQEDAESNYIKAVSVARIEQMEPYLLQVFQSIANAREFLAEQAEFPGLSAKMKSRINRLVKRLNKVDMFVSTKLLEELDKMTIDVNKEENDAEKVEKQA